MNEVKHKLPELFQQIINNDRRISVILKPKVVSLALASKFIGQKKAYIRNAVKYIQRQRGA